MPDDFAPERETLSRLWVNVYDLCVVWFIITEYLTITSFRVDFNSWTDVVLGHIPSANDWRLRACWWVLQQFLLLLEIVDILF